MFAQLTRAAEPLASAHRGGQSFVRSHEGARHVALTDRHQAGRLFALGIHEVFVTIDACECGKRRLRPLRHKTGAPADRGSRIDEGGNRVAQIVLTVAERALAVLPRFAPVNRRQRDDQQIVPPARGLAPRTRVDDAPELQQMTVRRVVIDRRGIRESCQRT